LIRINNSDIDFVEKTVSPNHADGKTFVLSKINKGFPFEIGKFNNYVVSVSRKITFCRADTFSFAFLDFDAEKVGVKSLENTKSASRV